MLIISYIITAALVIIVGAIHKYKRDRAFDLATMSMITFVGLVIMTIPTFVLSSDGTELSYTTVVNGDKFYCERASYEYDASHLWPGTKVTRYNSDEALAICYPLNDTGNK